MPEEISNGKITLTQGTAISIGLAVMLGSYAVWAAVQVTSLQSQLENMSNSVKEIKSDYVSKGELLLQLQNIDLRLQNIEAALVPKRK